MLSRTTAVADMVTYSGEIFKMSKRLWRLKMADVSGRLSV